MKRCCDGTTYVQPNGPGSWTVLCAGPGCDRVLAVVDGPRDEVYAAL